VESTSCDAAREVRVEGGCEPFSAISRSAWPDLPSRKLERGWGRVSVKLEQEICTAVDIVYCTHGLDDFISPCAIRDQAT
jgi:hypothetical protein